MKRSIFALLGLLLFATTAWAAEIRPVQSGTVYRIDYDTTNSALVISHSSTTLSGLTNTNVIADAGGTFSETVYGTTFDASVAVLAATMDATTLTAAVGTIDDFAADTVTATVGVLDDLTATTATVTAGTIASFEATTITVTAGTVSDLSATTVTASVGTVDALGATTVTATSYIGDGSALTGLQQPVWTSLVVGTDVSETNTTSVFNMMVDTTALFGAGDPVRWVSDGTTKVGLVKSATTTLCTVLGPDVGTTVTAFQYSVFPGMVNVVRMPYIADWAATQTQTLYTDNKQPLRWSWDDAYVVGFTTWSSASSNSPAVNMWVGSAASTLVPSAQAVTLTWSDTAGAGVSLTTYQIYYGESFDFAVATTAASVINADLNVEVITVPNRE